MAGIDLLRATITNNAARAVKESAVKANRAVNSSVLSSLDAKILGGRGAQFVSEARAKDTGLLRQLIPGEGELSKTVKYSIGLEDRAKLAGDISASMEKNTAKISEYKKQLSELTPDTLEHKTVQGHIDNLTTANASLSSSLTEVGSGTLTSRASLWDQGKQYFGHEEFGTNRKIAAGVGVGAAMLGTRYATGGSLTRNGRGENDIVGIPFI